MMALFQRKKKVNFKKTIPRSSKRREYDEDEETEEEEEEKEEEYEETQIDPPESVFKRRQLPTIENKSLIKKNSKEITKVVKELPVQQIKQYEDEEGNIVNLITIEEALTEFLNQ